MNITQELITNSFSIGHAVITIANLHDTALQQIDLYKKEEMTDSFTYLKLVKIQKELDSLLTKAKEVKTVIDKIDDKPILELTV